MELPNHIREGLEVRFLEALNETKDPETGYLRKGKAIKHAIGLVGRDAPHLYFEACQLGPESVMDLIANGYFTKTRSRLKSGFQEYGRDLSLGEMIEGFAGEIVSFPVDGQRENLRKFVKDCTPYELLQVIRGYERRAAENGAYADRYRALYERVIAAGLAEDRPISEAI